MTDQISEQRLDKWLWHARVTKTRTLAQKLITAGKIRANRNKINSPSTRVRPGHVLTITLPREIKVLEIKGLSERRGPFSEAQKLYIDLTPAKPDQKPEPVAETNIARKGRPDKHKRRQAREMKRHFTI